VREALPAEVSLATPNGLWRGGSQLAESVGFDAQFLGGLFCVHEAPGETGEASDLRETRGGGRLLHASLPLAKRLGARQAPVSLLYNLNPSRTREVTLDTDGIVPTPFPVLIAVFSHIR
jgi:hypothetical protein